MSWNDLDPHLQLLAQQTLTQPQLEAWKLELAYQGTGRGTRTIANHLGITRAALIERLNSAHHKLDHAGVRQDASGNYYLERTA